jgi:hypothetical protein
METAKDMDILKQAGLYEREYQQAGIDDHFKRWKEVELYKVKRIEILGNAIRAMVGAQIVSTTPLYRPSDWAQISAIAATGIATYATMYSGPKKDIPSSNFLLGSYGESRSMGMNPQPSLISGPGSLNLLNPSGGQP